MKPISCHVDEVSLAEMGVRDLILRKYLDESLTQRFEQQCSPILKALLRRCSWSVTTQANVAILLIHCPDSPTNWQVLYHIGQIGRSMAQFSQDAKICIHPPVGTADPFEIRVDELSIYVEPAFDPS